MHRGYVKLFRKLLYSDLWLGEKFTRAQAWIDLILLANYKKGFIRKRGIKVKLSRGDIGWSERKLSERWRWSRGKVKRFLVELCSGNEPELIPQTEPQNKHITSCYSIVKYDLYQGDDTTKQTTSDTTDGPQTGHRQDLNKKVKKDKKVKNKDILLCPYEKIIEIYHKRLPELSLVKNISDVFKKQLKARWREDKDRQNLEWWEWYFDGVSKCDHLVGKRTDWAASFYWLTGPKNMTKVLNGEYVNRDSKKAREGQVIREFIDDQKQKEI